MTKKKIIAYANQGEDRVILVLPPEKTMNSLQIHRGQYYNSPSPVAERAYTEWLSRAEQNPRID